MAERGLFPLNLFRILKQNKHLNLFPLYPSRKDTQNILQLSPSIYCIMQNSLQIPCKMSNPTSKQKKSRDEKTRCSPKKNIPRFAPGHCGRAKGAGGKVHFVAKKKLPQY
ncbi:hypothetical protein CDAR_193991 [Caerostris darwini]|uniref:Uncharacterized protein n=1 Tax=Caerostris darwini TaxID=1538125 RepID=A0AAV4SZA1_9ARAC|nr:hypothetical protein CDAR_193991 [Caerostris darwini]